MITIQKLDAQWRFDHPVFRKGNFLREVEERVQLVVLGDAIVRLILSVSSGRHFILTKAWIKRKNREYISSSVCSV